MPTNAFTSAGTTLGVSATAPATFDAAGYAALTFTAIGDITDMGEIGTVYEDIPHKPLGERGTYHFKGGFDDGGLQLQMAEAFADDAGQVILKAALASDADYYFVLEFNDNPDGTTNTLWYFPAKTFSAPLSVGNVSSLTTKTVNIMVNGDIVEVAATSA